MCPLAPRSRADRLGSRFAPLAAVLCAPVWVALSSGIAGADPDESPRSTLAARLGRMSVTVRQSSLELVTVRRPPDDPVPVIVERYDAEYSDPCERWTRRALIRPRTSKPAWQQVLQALEREAIDDLRAVLLGLPPLAIVVSDGGRALVAGRSPEGWWTERHLTATSHDARPAAFFGWLDGPSGEPLIDFVKEAPYVFSTTEGGETTWILPWTRQGAFESDVGDALASGAVPMRVMRIRFSVDGRLRHVRHTRCLAPEDVRRLASDVATSGGAIAHPRDFEEHALDLRVLDHQESRGAWLPAWIRSVGFNGGHDESWFVWREAAAPCGDSRFSTSDRLPETQGADVYFRVDDLSGRAWKAEGSQVPVPWSEDDERGPAAHSPRRSLRRGLLLAAVGAIIAAVLLASVRAWRHRS